MPDKLPSFTDLRGNPAPKIQTDTQLKRYLAGQWNEKSKIIEGLVGLSIVHATRTWHLTLKVGGRRHHRTLGTYPKVSLLEAKKRRTSDPRCASQRALSQRWEIQTASVDSNGTDQSSYARSKFSCDTSKVCSDCLADRSFQHASTSGNPETGSC